MARIWQLFRTKLAKLDELFDLEKKIPNFFVQKKNTTHLWQMGPCFEID
jgi:hypothetical protein